MAFFRNIAAALSDFTQRAVGTVSPFQISEISLSTFQNLEVVRTDDDFKLCKDKNGYKAILCNSSQSKKYFQIFQLSNLDEATSMLNTLSLRMQRLIHSSSILFSLSDLQRISDVIRKHPGYECAHIAAYLGFTNLLSKEFILESLNSIDPETGMTPLHVAIEEEYLECVQELLISGANLATVDRNGQTVFHLAAKCKSNNIIKMLASRDASLINQFNNDGETALHVACLSDLPDNVEMLLRWKVNPALTECHRYPIHYAAASNSTRCVAVLHRWDPKIINIKDELNGNSVLHIADGREMICCLTELGCSLELRNVKNQTALLSRVENGDFASSLALLIAGADVSARDASDNGVLHLAVQEDHPDLVQLLIVFGANVNLCNSEGFSPRHLAACSTGTHSDLMVHYLHMVGAVRCDKSKMSCQNRCSYNGSSDGKGKETTESNDQLKTLVDDFSESSAIFAALSRSESSTSFEPNSMQYEKPGDRILCLDGGGIRGLVTIKILMAIEEITGQPIRKCFDWIGGTSTGGILTIGLLQGKSLSYMMGAYFQMKNDVFQGKRPYDSELLESFIKREFGEWSKMSDIGEPKVMLMSVVADRMPAELYVFKNYEIPGVSHNPFISPFKKFPPIPRPQDQLIWQAVRATGAAPTYFRASGRFIDGGLVSNNPSLDVLTEIHKYNTACKATGKILEIPPLHVVVSLGTGKIPLRFMEDCDVYRPGIFDFTRVVTGAINLGELLINQATQSEGQSVNRAAAWCNMIDVPFFRFSPQLSEFIPLDCTDDSVLINMLWETQCYIHRNHEKIAQLGSLLL